MKLLKTFKAYDMSQTNPKPYKISVFQNEIDTTGIGEQKSSMHGSEILTWEGMRVNRKKENVYEILHPFGPIEVVCLPGKGV